MHLTKEDLADRFLFNDWANKKVLNVIGEMNDPSEGVRLFSHLITSQDKWMARIKKTPGYEKLHWFEEPFSLSELQFRWSESLNNWLQYLDDNTVGELNTVREFLTDEGDIFSLSPAEIVTQLNFHSPYHRAQIVYVMRLQGMQPPSTDYSYYAVSKKKTTQA
ncbi:MAG: DinB family protein [Chitinophagaceae bacterium]